MPLVMPYTVIVILIESKNGIEYDEDKDKPHWFKENNHFLYH